MKSVKHHTWAHIDQIDFKFGHGADHNTFLYDIVQHVESYNTHIESIRPMIVLKVVFLSYINLLNIQLVCCF